MVDELLGQRIHPLLRRCVLSFLLVVLLTPAAHSGTFTFAELNGLDVVTHPIGYNGTGGVISITVGIDNMSPNAAAMEIPVQNLVTTFNALMPTTGNLIFGGSTNIPTGFVDFESTALHELGHSLGLAHVNLATESGLTDPNRNYTKTRKGTNNVYDLGIGTDIVRGSTDDARGDDDNLYWFRKTNNNPFTIAGTVDGSTYSRSTGDLPVGHTFAANGDRSVSTLFSVPNTEAVMQQGQFSNEAQRTLTHGDVATLRLARAGMDRISGNSDDYTVVLTYSGQVTPGTGADIILKFDNSQTSFAVSKNFGTFLNSVNIAITSTAIFFNTGSSWFFNDVLAASTLPIVYVNFDTGSPSGSGTVGNPVDSVGAALLLVEDDGRILITAGSTTETLTVNQAVTLERNGGNGSVIIGDPAARGAAKSGFISPPRTRPSGK